MPDHQTRGVAVPQEWRPAAPRYAFVTGAAGFIGSALCRRLVAGGSQVIGIDSFTSSYDPARKWENLDGLTTSDAFTLIHAGLTDIDLSRVLADVNCVFHLAAEPGVRASWGDGFEPYLENNVAATQVLLEAARAAKLDKFVYASSASVYGNAASMPTSETELPRPVSPYGMTKLAAEHLCEMYAIEYGLPVASLRLFNVYGPGERPDMALSRLVSAGLDARSFPLYGDGSQTRDLTYVDDVTTALVQAADSSWCGVANVGGGGRVSIKETIDLVAELCGPISIERHDDPRGDPRHTSADVRLAAAGFGYTPTTPFRAGVTAMVAAMSATTSARRGAGTVPAPSSGGRR